MTVLHRPRSTASTMRILNAINHEKMSKSQQHKTHHHHNGTFSCRSRCQQFTYQWHTPCHRRWQPAMFALRPQSVQVAGQTRPHTEWGPWPWPHPHPPAGLGGCVPSHIWCWCHPTTNSNPQVFYKHKTYLLETCVILQSWLLSVRFKKQLNL